MRLLSFYEGYYCDLTDINIDVDVSQVQQQEEGTLLDMIVAII